MEQTPVLDIRLIVIVFFLLPLLNFEEAEEEDYDDWGVFNIRTIGTQVKEHICFFT